MPRLPELLTVHDLALAELHAARLDGLLHPVGASFRFADRPDDRAMRFADIAGQVPDRMVVCEESAAWLWGAVDVAPAPLRLCSRPRHRARLAPSGHVVARELRLEPGDTVEVPVARRPARPVTLTTALRTTVDLALAADRRSAAEALRGMIAIVGVAVEDASAVLEANRRRPGRITALRALERAGSAGAASG
jgi:hypothetical protein